MSVFAKCFRDMIKSVSQNFDFHILFQNPNEQQAFYQACVAGDEVLKQSYHEQYFSHSLSRLQKHVNYLVNELDEMAEFKWNKNTERHPRLPLLLRHNEFVMSTFEIVQQTLDDISV